MTVENIFVQPPVNSRDMNSVNGPVRQLFSSRSLKSAVLVSHRNDSAESLFSAISDQRNGLLS